MTHIVTATSISANVYIGAKDFARVYESFYDLSHLRSQYRYRRYLPQFHITYEANEI